MGSSEIFHKVPVAVAEPPRRRDGVAAVAVSAGLQARYIELFGDEGPSTSHGVVAASTSPNVAPSHRPPAQARVERQSAASVPDGSLASGTSRRRQMPGLVPISQFSLTEGPKQGETAVAAAVVPQGMNLSSRNTSKYPVKITFDQIWPSLYAEACANNGHKRTQEHNPRVLIKKLTQNQIDRFQQPPVIKLTQPVKRKRIVSLSGSDSESDSPLHDSFLPDLSYESNDEDTQPLPAFSSSESKIDKEVLDKVKNLASKQDSAKDLTSLHQPPAKLGKIDMGVSNCSQNSKPLSFNTMFKHAVQKSQESKLKNSNAAPLTIKNMQRVGDVTSADVRSSEPTLCKPKMSLTDNTQSRLGLSKPKFATQAGGPNLLMQRQKCDNKNLHTSSNNSSNLNFRPSKSTKTRVSTADKAISVNISLTDNLLFNKNLSEVTKIVGSASRDDLELNSPERVGNISRNLSKVIAAFKRHQRDLEDEMKQEIEKVKKKYVIKNDEMENNINKIEDVNEELLKERGKAFDSSYAARKDLILKVKDLFKQFSIKTVPETDNEKESDDDKSKADGRSKLDKEEEKENPKKDNLSEGLLSRITRRLSSENQNTDVNHQSHSPVAVSSSRSTASSDLKNLVFPHLTLPSNATPPKYSSIQKNVRSTKQLHMPVGSVTDTCKSSSMSDNTHSTKLSQLSSKSSATQQILQNPSIDVKQNKLPSMATKSLSRPQHEQVTELVKHVVNQSQNKQTSKQNQPNMALKTNNQQYREPQVEPNCKAATQPQNKQTDKTNNQPQWPAYPQSQPTLSTQYPQNSQQSQNLQTNQSQSQKPMQPYQQQQSVVSQQLPNTFLINKNVNSQQTISVQVGSPDVINLQKRTDLTIQNSVKKLNFAPAITVHRVGESQTATSTSSASTIEGTNTSKTSMRKTPDSISATLSSKNATKDDRPKNQASSTMLRTIPEANMARFGNVTFSQGIIHPESPTASAQGQQQQQQQQHHPASLSGHHDTTSSSVTSNTGLPNFSSYQERGTVINVPSYSASVTQTAVPTVSASVASVQSSTLKPVDSPLPLKVTVPLNITQVKKSNPIITTKGRPLTVSQIKQTQNISDRDFYHHGTSPPVSVTSSQLRHILPSVIPQGPIYSSAPQQPSVLPTVQQTVSQPQYPIYPQSVSQMYQNYSQYCSSQPQPQSLRTARPFQQHHVLQQTARQPYSHLQKPQQPLTQMPTPQQSLVPLQLPQQPRMPIQTPQQARLPVHTSQPSQLQARAHQHQLQTQNKTVQQPQILHQPQVQSQGSQFEQRQFQSFSATFEGAPNASVDRQGGIRLNRPLHLAQQHSEVQIVENVVGPQNQMHFTKTSSQSPGESPVRKMSAAMQQHSSSQGLYPKSAAVSIIPPAQGSSKDEITTCFLCGRDATLVCCGAFVYCGTECKNDDYERHKSECRGVKR